MRLLFTIVIAALSLNAVGQVEYPFPYNPDGNADGYISLADLMDFLALYGQEYPDSFYSDTTRAVLNLGEMGAHNCSMQAEIAGREWRVMSMNDINLFGPLVVKTFQEPAADHYVRIDYRERPYDAIIRFRLDENTGEEVTYDYLYDNLGNKYLLELSQQSDFNLYTKRECVLVSELRPEYEYSSCSESGGPSGYFETCIESKLHEGWIPLQGVNHNWYSQYQGFWRIKD